MENNNRFFIVINIVEQRVEAFRMSRKYLKRVKPRDFPPLDDYNSPVEYEIIIHDDTDLCELEEFPSFNMLVDDVNVQEIFRLEEDDE